MKTASQSSNSTSPSEAKTIVIVDDSIDLIDTYKQVLEPEGYRIHLAGSGPEALDLLRNISPPDLLLVDCLMPRMNGIEFLTELRDTNPTVFSHTPIVGLSCLANDSPTIESMKLLVSRISDKPLDLETIIRLVAENVRK